MKLEYHQVSISIEEQVRAGRQKVYMLDIGVHGYPMPPTAQELVEDAAEIVRMHSCTRSKDSTERLVKPRCAVR